MVKENIVAEKTSQGSETSAGLEWVINESERGLAISDRVKSKEERRRNRKEEEQNLKWRG